MSNDGQFTTDFGTPSDAVNDVDWDPARRVTAVGTAGGDLAIARYDARFRLDRAFSVDGRVTTDLGGTDDALYGVVPFDDGSAVAVGGNGSTAVLLRMRADGALDPGFGRAGIVHRAAGGPWRSVALAPDGSLVVAGGGAGEFTVARYASDNGALVALWPLAVTSDAVAYGVTVQPDGKIIAAGSSGGGAVGVRLTASGAVDTGFGSGGFVRPEPTRAAVAYGVVVDADGRVVLAGDGPTKVGFLARYAPDGSLDTSFDGGGVGVSNTGASFTAIDRNPEGYWAAAASHDGRMAIGNTSSSPWRPGEVSFADPPQDSRDAVRLPDGRLLVVVRVSYDVGLVRFNPDGSLDRTFGVDGRIQDDILSYASGLVVQPNGRIVVAGSFADKAAVAGFLPDGRVDPSFGVNGRTTTDEPWQATAIAMHDDGRIVVTVGGRELWHALVRFSPSGAIDPTFGEAGLVRRAPPIEQWVHRLAVQPDGRILALGGLGQVYRYLPDGDPDASFGSSGGSGGSGGGKVTVDLRQSNLDWWTADILVQPDGKVLVGGSGATCGPALERLNPDGSLDPGWRRPATRAATCVSGYVGRLRLDPDGKVYAVGNTTVRFRANGTIDTRFGIGGRVGDLGNPVGMFRAPDGSLLLIGFIAPFNDPGDGTVSVTLLRETAPPNAVAWGWNGVGPLGDGTGASRPTPGPVTGLANAATVSAGLYHSLAVRDDGTVWAWGWNAFGQLGDGATADRASPVQVAGLTDVVAVAAGAAHSLALRRDGTVWAWGWNAVGQLGDGTTADRRTPVRALVDNVTVIAAGAHHSLAIRYESEPYAWGWNALGQLGDGTTVDRSIPTYVAALGSTTSIAGGWYHTVATGYDGVYAWGWNGAGQLGNGTTTDSRLPVKALSAGNHQVSAGAAHTIVRSGSSTVLAWGWNGLRQVGDGLSEFVLKPHAVDLPGTIVSVSAGSFHNLVNTADGSVWGWGWNGYGQLGDGTTVDRGTPVRTAGTSPRAIVSAGGAHSLAT